MEFRRYWEIVLRYKGLIISLVLCASLGALAATYMLTEPYTASSLVLIRPQETRRVTDPPAGMKEKEVLGFPLVGTEANVFNRSYAGIIQSRGIAKKIVDDLGLDKLSNPKESNLVKRAWKFVKDQAKFCIYVGWTLMKHGRFERPDPYENLIDNVKYSLSAEPIRDTYLIQIDATSDDPDFAALLANSATDAFIDYWGEAYYNSTEEDLGILEGQAEANEAELNALMTTVEAYKEKEGILNLEVQILEKISSMSHFEMKVRQVEADISEVIHEIETIERELHGIDLTSMATTIVSSNPVAIELQKILVDLEIEMAGARERFTPSHPEVIALRAKIEETKKRLAAEETYTVSDETSEKNPVYLGMEERLALLKTKLPAMEAKRDGYQETVEKYGNEIEALRDKTKELSILERQVETLKAIHSEFVMGVRDYRVLSIKKPEEIHLVSAATPPLYPTGPIKVIHTGIAAGMALVVGIALAFFLEYINVRIRTIEEAESSLDLPVLATIPKIVRTSNSERPEILLPKPRPDSS